MRSILRGLIPVYEEHDARISAGIKLGEWTEMEPMEKALVVAHHRIANAVRNHQADAEIRMSKKHQQQAAR